MSFAFIMPWEAFLKFTLVVNTFQRTVTFVAVSVLLAYCLNVNVFIFPFGTLNIKVLCVIKFMVHIICMFFVFAVIVRYVKIIMWSVFRKSTLVFLSQYVYIQDHSGKRCQFKLCRLTEMLNADDFICTIGHEWPTWAVSSWIVEKMTHALEHVFVVKTFYSAGIVVQ
jgi:hypothetical protein